MHDSDGVRGLPLERSKERAVQHTIILCDISPVSLSEKDRSTHSASAISALSLVTVSLIDVSSGLSVPILKKIINQFAY